jgi:hypothetical protein
VTSRSLRMERGQYHFSPPRARTKTTTDSYNITVNRWSAYLFLHAPKMLV